MQRERRKQMIFCFRRGMVEGSYVAVKHGLMQCTWEERALLSPRPTCSMFHVVVGSSNKLRPIRLVFLISPLHFNYGN